MDLYSIKPSSKCERCYVWNPSIRVVNKKEDTVQFICELCLKEDASINQLPIKKKPQVPWYRKLF